MTLNTRSDDRDQVSIEVGKDVRGNIVINPPVNYTEELTLPRNFNDIVEKIDDDMAVVFPNGIRSYVTRKNESFSVEKLINSLNECGIPLRIAVIVASNVHQKLMAKVEQLSEYDFSDLRRLIYVTITSLDYKQVPSLKPGSAKPLYWGESYIRSYGSPDKLPRVIYEDGEVDELHLGYKYIRTKIIPYVLSELNGIDPVDQEQAFTSRDLKHASMEILRLVKQMKVYHINYDTLLRLARDMAVQPPHPWGVDRNNLEKTINYDLNQASAHFNELRIIDELVEVADNEKLSYSRHKALECLHHSCSAILAYLGISMGAGPLAPFHTLRHLLKCLLDGQEHLLIEHSYLREMKNDLEMRMGFSYMQAAAYLEDVKRRIAVAHQDSIVPDLIVDAGRLYRSALKIVESEKRLSDMLDELDGLRDSNPSKSTMLLKKLFTKLNGFEIGALKENYAVLWKRHESATFDTVSPRILVHLHFSKKPIEYLELNERVSELQDEITNFFSNLLIYVTNSEFTNEARELAQAMSKRENYVVLPLELGDLRTIFAQRNWMEGFENILRKHIE